MIVTKIACRHLRHQTVTGANEKPSNVLHRWSCRAEHHPLPFLTPVLAPTVSVAQVLNSVTTMGSFDPRVRLWYIGTVDVVVRRLSINLLLKLLPQSLLERKEARASAVLHTHDTEHPLIV